MKKLIVWGIVTMISARIALLGNQAALIVFAGCLLAVPAWAFIWMNTERPEPVTVRRMLPDNRVFTVKENKSQEALTSNEKPCTPPCFPSRRGVVTKTVTNEQESNQRIQVHRLGNLGSVEYIENNTELTSDDKERLGVFERFFKGNS